MTRYDVAVVGLGAMGAAALYQLARRGARVIGLDRFAPPHGQGSSHGETRITRAAVGEGEAYVPLVQATHRIWRDLEREAGTTLFVDCGMLLLANAGPGAAVHGEADFLGSTADIARRFAVPHELLDANEVGRRFPMLTPSAGTEAYLEPDAGYVIPEACIEVQLGLAASYGAAILIGTEVTTIAETGNGVTLETEAGPVMADRVIVAAGGWSGPLLGAPFDRLLRVFPQAFHWLTLAPEFAIKAPFPAFIWLHGGADTGHFYGFPPLPGARSLKLATERYGEPAAMHGLARHVPAEAAGSFHRDHVAGRIRSVEATAERSTTCAYTVTPDYGFIIDRHPDMARVTVVSACSGHGFKHSAGIGLALAESLTHGTSTIDLAPFSLARFRA